jgi:hypothetical protein
MHDSATDRPDHAGARISGLLAALLLVVLACGGCSKPLLAPAEERTPFDRYDAVRGNYAPQYIEDEFGRRQPNLRARLTPKD